LTSLSLRCEYLTESQRFIAGDRKKKSRLKAGISLWCRYRLTFLKEMLFWRQNSSSCWPWATGSSFFLPMKISISPNCLSVIQSIPTCPRLGKNDLTLRICTSAFSRLAQCLK